MDITLMNRLIGNIENGYAAAAAKAGERAERASKVYSDLMAVLDKHVPTTDYMAAENACTMDDVRWREKWGEDSDTVNDLRRVRKDVLDGIRGLADDIARLAREVAITKAA